MIRTRGVASVLSKSANAACLAGVLLIAGCAGSATGPGRLAPLVSISTGAPPSYPFPAPQVVGTASTVSVSAVLVTGTPCYSVSATDRIDGKDLIIDIVAKSTNSPCIPMTLVAQYTVTSRDVPISVTHVTMEQRGFVASDSVVVDTDVARLSGETAG